MGLGVFQSNRETTTDRSSRRNRTHVCRFQFAFVRIRRISYTLYGRDSPMGYVQDRPVTSNISISSSGRFVNNHTDTICLAYSSCVQCLESRRRELGFWGRPLTSEMVASAIQSHGLAL